MNQKLNQLPPDYPEDLLPAIQKEFLESEKTIVVLDDDPTGTQTCYDVTVLTSWEIALIAAELRLKPSILYILTNSRSLSEPEAVDLALEIGRNLKEAAKESQRQVVVVSRSDSTLRGHFPAEVDAVAGVLGLAGAVTVLVPAFIEGERYTMDDVHYIVENEELVPVSDTPFAKDASFGYQHANLKLWVEEKTRGRIKASDVNSVSIEDLRAGGPKLVAEKLEACADGSVCVMNAASYRDLEVGVLGLVMAEKSGKKFLYRTSATFVPIRAGMVSGKLYVPQKEDTASSHGSLVVVGSHVPKTTAQLAWLLSKGQRQTLEVDVSALLQSQDVRGKAKATSAQVDAWLAAGDDAVIHTSRTLEKGSDAESSLKINSLVSGFLVAIVQGISVRPKFMVAKGGITSSDLASKGLSVKKATVLGPVIPGVPVWKLQGESKFPGLIYVVFPGNVGDEKALALVCEKFGGG
ncbi:MULTISPECIES: four-carbon acid sugar kinase family protein [unclassified Imperialibacter]|uniref:four-carbon acid sugar kinase family protein n=1 Tax=unclassified Imperialibacter TaxID=2629706 RepID=UPI001D001B21|nr:MULTISPECIES: four-carbon acid sugar kinase family protein [unclassified Imperialibacter]